MKEDMKEKDKNVSLDSPLSRRTFLKTSTVAAAALSLNPMGLLSRAGDLAGAVSSKSIVSVIKDARSITDGFVIDGIRVRAMVDEGIKAITGTGSIKEAWLKIFPDLKEKEVIGLKVNTINKRIPAHPQVAFAIVDSMVDAGINKKNILIWDNLEKCLTDAGYKINTTDEGYRCYGTYHGLVGPNNRIKVQPADPMDVYRQCLDMDAKVYIKSENIERHHSKILSKQIDYLINVPVLKSAEFAGVTLSMKNMYGTINLSEQATFGIFQADMPSVVEKMHAHRADPQISEVNFSEQLMKKTKLVVLDALMGIYEGSAHVDPQGVNHKIIMSTDRVATDFTGYNLINDRRKEKGLPAITTEHAGHIWSAEKLGIGNADPAKIDVRSSVLQA